MNPKILMVIPTLGRPERLSNCLHSLILNGTGKHDILIMDGDRWFYEKANAIPVSLLERYEILGLMGNDCLMRTPRWDEFVIAKLSSRIGLLYGRDGIQNRRLATAPFISVRMCLCLGFVYPPGFFHHRGDRALCALAKAAGCLYYEPGLYTEHLHFCNRKAKMDAIYQKGIRAEPHDESVWRRYIRNQIRSDIQKLKTLLGR